MKYLPPPKTNPRENREGGKRAQTLVKHKAEFVSDAEIIESVGIRCHRNWQLLLQRSALCCILVVPILPDVSSQTVFTAKPCASTTPPLEKNGNKRRLVKADYAIGREAGACAERSIPLRPRNYPPSNYLPPGSDYRQRK
ncbi:unnamed protein product [Victoria cruziana]